MGRTSKKLLMLAAVLTGFCCGCRSQLSEYDRLLQQDMLAQAPAIDLTSFPKTKASFVIITDGELAPAFEEYADYKSLQGIPTRVIEIDWISDNFSAGADSPENIREFIRFAHRVWGTKWVMLGGDVNIVPTSCEQRGSGFRNYPGYDHYYWCLDSADWYYRDPLEAQIWPSILLKRASQSLCPPWYPNLNDYCADVCVGRLPARSASEIADYLNKVRQYEQGRKYEGYQQRAVLLGGFLNYGFNGQVYVDTIANRLAGSIRCRKFVTGGDGPASEYTKEDFIGALNAGCAMLYVYSRGDETYFFTQPEDKHKVYREDIDALTNTGMYPVMLVISGAPCNIEQDCIGERFVLNPVGGGVGCLGTAGPGDQTHGYIFKVLQRWYEGLDETVGEVITLINVVDSTVRPDSSVAYAGCGAWGHLSRDAFYLGDPTLYLWTGSPHEFTVTHPDHLDKGGGQSVRVRVYDGGSPVDRALVTLSCHNRFYKTAYTGEDGLADFKVDITDNVPVAVGVRKRDFWFYCDTIEVRGHQPFVVLDSLIWMNKSGNHEKNLHAHGTSRCRLMIRNTGDVALKNITCRVSSGHAAVTLQDSVVVVAGLAPHQRVITDSEIVFRISDRVEDLEYVNGLQVYFLYSDTVVVETAGFHVARAVPYFAGSFVDDDRLGASFGDGDGFVERGECIELPVAIGNRGHAAMKDVRARLIPHDSTQVSFRGGDAEIFYEHIPPLSSVTPDEKFTFTCFGDTTPVLFTLLIEDQYGLRDLGIFAVTVNDAHPENVKFACRENSLRLSWSCPALAPPAGFNIYRSGDGERFAKINRLPVYGSSFFDDVGLAADSTYHYRITSLNLDGTESNPSAVFTAATTPSMPHPWPLDKPVSSITPLVAPSEAGGAPGVFFGSSSDGVLWSDTSGKVDVYWSHGSGDTLLFGLMALAAEDIDSDGKLDVIAPTSGLVNRIRSRENGADSDSWSVSLSDSDVLYCSGVSIADLDHDGDYEIFALTKGGRILALTHDGRPAFGTSIVFDSIGCGWNTSGVAIGDVTGDARLNLVVSGSNDSIYVFDDHGRRVRGFPVSVARADIVPRYPYSRKNCYDPSSPVLADFDGDRAGLEILVQWGYEQVYIIDPQGNGEVVFSLEWPVKHFGSRPASYTGQPPGVIDVDNDGILEIVMLYHDQIVVLDQSGEIKEGWPFHIQGVQSTGRDNMFIVGDIDDDEQSEILVNLYDGFLYSFESDGAQTLGFPIPLGETFRNVPLLCDLAGDGRLWILKGADVLKGWPTRRTYRPENMLWPAVRHDNHRTCSILGTRPVLRHLDTLRTVRTGDRVPVAAEVFEPDARWGDSLTFVWTATEGLIEGSGPGVVYAAPSTASRVSLNLLVYDCGGNTIKAGYTFEVTESRGK